MRTVTAQTTNAWLSGDYVGPNRPMCRVTIQSLNAIQATFGTEVYSSAIFGNTFVPRELPNVKSVSWERSTDTDAATCTIQLYNTEPLPIGSVAERESVFGVPGAFTFNHGKTTFSSRWNHQPTTWQDRLRPDRIIRTYEGFGFDATKTPENDPHMYQSGVWLIDDITETHDGLIEISCRDLGRLLLDQIMFPPVVPFAKYPLHFTPYHPVPNPPIVSSGVLFVPAYDTDSNVPYVGYNGAVYGHHGSDAFDGINADTFWMSIGNARPNQGYSFEFIQGHFAPQPVAGIKFRVWGGPYTYYLSIRQNGKWIGALTIPYDPNNPASAPNGANIPFIVQGVVQREQVLDFPFGQTFENVDAIRLTFTDLFNSGVGTYKYRAGVRTFEVYSSLASSTPGGTHTEGDFGDYTEVIRKLLAYGGFWWPKDSHLAVQTKTGGAQVVAPAPSDDSYLGHGRIWGDLQVAGTASLSELTPEIFDKKPLMDGVNYVRDILGFVFFIDETGGAVFRQPNIWSVGNWIGNGGPSAGRTGSLITVDEEQTLLSLKAKLSSRNVREHIFIANVNGRIGAVVDGYSPIKTGLRRVAGWTDMNFATNDECTIMADLIKVRQIFEYRTDTLTIVGNPAIQIDDQVRIYEATTEEGYIHYVKAIKMSWDIESGKYTYDLDTHWLGETPFDNWAFDPSTLNPVTIQYLQTIGVI